MEEEEVVVGGMEEGGKTSDSDSFSSDPRLSRQSPPTQVCSHSTSDVNVFLLSIIYLLSLTHLTSSSFFQVQSLSEESSGCSTRRRQPALSPSSPRWTISTGSSKMFNFYLSPALDLSRAWTRVGGIRSVKEKEEEEEERLPIRMFGYPCQDLGQVY